MLCFFAASLDSASMQLPVQMFRTNNGKTTLFQGKGKLIYFNKKASTLFIADPSIADFSIKSPGILFLLPKKLGNTNLIGVDKEGEVVFSLDIHVDINKAEIYKILRSVAPGSSLKVENFGETVLLKGSVQYPSTLANIEAVMKKYLNGVSLHNMVKITNPPQVYIKVKVVEVSKSIGERLGINWQLGYSDQHVSVGTGFGAAPQGSGLSTARLGLQFSAYLDALVQKGLATILAQPNLTTLSGTKAKFLAGGQFPIPVSQALGVTTVQFQDFGAQLNFTPTIVNGDLINLQLDVEVSSLSQNGAIQTAGFNIPGLQTRSANVNVQLTSGESISIAGLLQKEIKQAIDKYPGFGDIPILGPLFRSKRFINNQSELVSIVTPYLVKASRHKLATPLDSLPQPGFDKFGQVPKGFILEKG